MPPDAQHTALARGPRPAAATCWCLRSLRVHPAHGACITPQEQDARVAVHRLLLALLCGRLPQVWAVSWAADIAALWLPSTAPPPDVETILINLARTPLRRVAMAV